MNMTQNQHPRKVGWIESIKIWLLNRHIITVKPWEDPRKSAADRAAWLEAQPKSLRKAG